METGFPKRSSSIKMLERKSLQSEAISLWYHRQLHGIREIGGREFESVPSENYARGAGISSP
jgi:hypothetical protein